MNGDAKQASALNLEERISAIESGREAGTDFGVKSWLWMLLFGVVMPVGLLVWGWSR